MNAFVVAALVAGLAPAQEPVYGNQAARQAVARMVVAHGGIERWRALRTLRYDNIFFNPSAPDSISPWWVSRETFNLRTKRTYHDWPVDGAKLGFDGTSVWSTGWRQGNPPSFQSFFFYYFVNLPWLALEPTAVVGPAGPASLPGRPESFDTVRVRWTGSQLPGRAEEDFFVLYIDRSSGLLRAYQYGIGYGPMLDLMRIPADRPYFGPLLRIHDAFTTVDGLVFPMRFHTASPDASRTFGYHTIINYSTKDPWVDALAAPPSGAVIDRLTNRRGGPK